MGRRAPLRVIAVDWSGRRAGAARHIWSATAAAGSLAGLEGGRDRGRLGDHLVAAALADPDLYLGLDFGFSLPLWFLDQEGLENGMAVSEAAAEAWLRDCPPPFWGRPGVRRGPEPQHRRTEAEVRPQARSVFQVGGAGAVGTGSLRGFGLLRRLRAEGFTIWPFDDPRPPCAVEIFPRLLTGPVVKRRFEARAAHLHRNGWPEVAAVTEDAFDAAVSALLMDRHREQLMALGPEPDPVRRREGRIWVPSAGAGRD